MELLEKDMLAKKVYGLLSKTRKINSWWPGDERFEIAVGAILTQSTSWSNVEKALTKLKKEECLNPKKMEALPDVLLSKLIKSSLYYNQKTRKLKIFSNYLLDNYDGSMKNLGEKNTSVLRKELLGLWGVGSETADSILLYALDKPVFVIDAYTKRLFSRLGLNESMLEYDILQNYFHKQIKKDALTYQFYHGLIVDHCKEICVKNKPKCVDCILENHCTYP